MRTLRVLRPIQAIEEVQASLDTFGGRIADRLDGRRPPPATENGAGGATFSYREVFDDLGRDLESLRLEVVGADDVHVRRQILSAAVGRQTEELGNGLYDHQVAARRVLGGAYAPDRSFELAAVSGITPQTFKPLEEQVDQTVKLLREPVAETPPLKLTGVDVDLDSVAGGLETNLEEFRAKRRELDRARKAVGESQVLLDRALAEFQAIFPWIAQILEAFARMAGERELADRIRTTVRRVVRRPNESGEGEAEPAPAGESSPEEPASGSETSVETASSVETAAS